MFRPRPLLEDTVMKTMEETLLIRDKVLSRTKAIRNKEVTICPDQNINQEDFLETVRMRLMEILLDLIKKDAATPNALQVK